MSHRIYLQLPLIEQRRPLRVSWQTKIGILLKWFIDIMCLSINFKINLFLTFDTQQPWPPSATHPSRPLEISNIYLLPFPAPCCCLLWCFVTSVLKLLRYTERMKIPFPFSTLDLNWKFMFAFFSFCSHRFWYNRVTLVPKTAQIYEYMGNFVQERYI